MTITIILNDRVIPVSKYKESIAEGLQRLTIEFKVSSEAYHEITTLLYKGEFDVNVPERDLEFKGIIAEYSTSLTNLYKSGEVGNYKLVLMEKKE